MIQTLAKPQSRGINSLERAIQIKLLSVFQSFGGNIMFPQLSPLSDFKVTKVFISKNSHVEVNF